MAVPIAELFVSVGADVSSAVAGLTALGTQLDGTAARFREAAPAALLLTGAAAGVGAVFGGAVKVAADFEHQMSGVKAVLSTDEVQQFGGALDSLALKLGRDTVFTSREAAAAIEELVKAGVPVADVLNGGAAAALNLAAATGVTTNEAATVASQALNTFKLSGDQATAVVDRLAAVANASASDISFLRFGMAATGGVAAALGLSFDDEAVALGLLSKSFANGSDAGTSFKTFLGDLIPHTKPATAEMKTLGLITAEGKNQFFDAAGHVKNFEGIAGTLRTALSGLTDQQRLSAIQTIFGTDAARAAIAIYGAGASGVKEFKDQTGESGVAATSARTRMDNLSGALQNLGGSIETVQIIIGNVFLPVLRAIVDGVRPAVDAFSVLAPQAQTAAVAIVGIAGAVAGLLGGFVFLAPFINALGPAFSALGSVLVSIAPLMLRLAGVAGILFAVWQTNLFGVRDLVGAAFDRIPDVLNTVSNVFANAGTLWENTILPALQNIANAIEQRVIPVFNAISAGPLGQLAVVFQKVFAGDIAGAVDTFQAIIGAIAPGLGALIVNVRSTLGSFFDTFGPILGNIGLVFEKVFAGDFAGAADTFRAIIGAISPEFGTFIDRARGVADAVGPVLGRAFEILGTFLSTEIVPAIRDLAANIMPFLLDSSRRIGEFWQTTLAPALARVGDFIATTVVPALQFLGNTVVPAVVQAFQNFVGFLLTEFGPNGENLIVLSGRVGSAFEAIGTALDGMRPTIAAVGGFIAQMAVDFATFAGGVGESVLKFFRDDLPPVMAAFGGQVESLGPLFGAFGGFLGAVNNLLVTLAGIGGSAVRGLFENVLVPGFQQLAQALGPIQPTLGAAGDAISKMASGFTTIGALLQPVTDFFNNAAKAINGLADALARPELAPLLTPGSGARLPGVPGPTEGNAGSLNGAIGPAITSATPLGPLINIGSLIISSEAEGRRFIQDMANAVAAAAGRVTAPPDNSAFPALSPAGAPS